MSFHFPLPPPPPPCLCSLALGSAAPLRWILRLADPSLVPVVSGTACLPLLNPSLSLVIHIHFWEYITFLNEFKKCIKNHNKYKKTSELLHFYGHNLGHPNNVKKLVWYKDYGLIIKKLFADSYRNFKIIIIHSDGEFFVESRLNEIPNNHLIRRKKWDDYKADFVRRCKALNNY